MVRYTPIPFTEDELTTYRLAAGMLLRIRNTKESVLAEHLRQALETRIIDELGVAEGFTMLSLTDHLQALQAGLPGAPEHEYAFGAPGQHPGVVVSILCALEDLLLAFEEGCPELPPSETILATEQTVMTIGEHLLGPHRT